MLVDAVESQIAELNMMTQTLTELERQHRQMKNTVPTFQIFLVFGH